ncbi:MAG: NGG1p interacting factor NIF3 [Candidatus Eisenbacteria bacterium]
MKLGVFYRRCIEAGIHADNRGAAGIKRLLKEEKDRYDKLEGLEKEFYDLERLKNPYTDCRILYGDANIEVKCMLVGIDAHSDELLLANELRRRGKKVDLVLTHHPAGHAVKRLPEVMDIQMEYWMSYGVPSHIAESLIADKKTWALRQFHVRNSDAPVDLARILDIPFMGVHTPADNWAATHMQQQIDKAKPRTVGDVVDVILKEPDYRHHAKLQAAPTIVTGRKENRCGKVYVDMTGGIMAGKDFLPELSRRGVSTIVLMHIPDDAVDKAKEEKMNVIIAGHIASDSLGMNLLLDNALDGKVEVIDCSGFRRFTRKPKK